MKPKDRNLRLNPKLTSDRYYVLVKLRNVLQSQIKLYIEPINKKKQHLKLLDFGCGDMPYRTLFEPWVHEYIGADIYGNTKADLTIDPFTGKVALGDNTIDIILSTQVLEHVTDPEKYLIEAKRLCKENGILLISTHGLWKYHPVPEDYWRWTGSGLCKILNQSGWETLEIRGILGFASSAVLLLQDAISNKLPPCILNKVIAIAIHQLVGLLDLIYSSEERGENACVYLVVAKPKYIGSNEM